MPSEICPKCHGIGHLNTGIMVGGIIPSGDAGIGMGAHELKKDCGVCSGTGRLPVCARGLRIDDGNSRDKNALFHCLPNGTSAPCDGESCGGWKCPKRPQGPFKFPANDSWRNDNTCGFCGSLNPEWLMGRLEAGDVQLTPTDKDYKVYVENAGGETFSTHGAAKFYFEHLSVEQRKRFVELLQAKKIKLDVPGHFYVLPFFIVRSGRDAE